MRARAKQLNLARFIRPCPKPGGSRPWSARELALLARLTDAEVAARTGRSVNAVRVKRDRVRGGE